MSDIMIGSDEGFQHYQQSISGPAILSDGLSHDATIITTTAVAATNILSPSNSNVTYGGGHEWNPNKGCISKPVRKRSRSLKKTPITLLNASTTNFRALVQQFTGCRSATLSLESRRGPVNLNFASPGQHTGGGGGGDRYSRNIQESQAHQQHYYHCQQEEEERRQQQHQLQQLQDQQCVFSLENNTSEIYGLW